MARAEPEDLVADRRDHRDEQDPADDHHDRRLPADQREGEDRQEDDDDEELGAAALVRGRVLADRTDRQRVARLEGVDRHVLGAVVLEDAADVRGAPDQDEVAEEDRDPDEPLDEVLDEAVLDVGGRHRGDEQRQQEEDPDAGQRGSATSIRTIEPLPSSTPSSSAWTLALRTSQRVPTTSVSYRTTRPRIERPLRPARPVEAGVEPLRGAHDVAVGMAQGDRDRVAAAHQDALDQGLAAVGVGGHVGQSTGCDGSGRNRNGGPMARRHGSFRLPAVGRRGPRCGPGAPGASGSARPGRPCR